MITAPARSAKGRRTEDGKRKAVKPRSLLTTFRFPITDYRFPITAYRLLLLGFRLRLVLALLDGGLRR
jgi:hypothetical protein